MAGWSLRCNRRIVFSTRFRNVSDCSVGRKNLAVRLRERVHEACADGGVLLRNQVVVVQREDGRKGVLEEEDVRVEEKDVVRTTAWRMILILFAILAFQSLDS